MILFEDICACIVTRGDVPLDGPLSTLDRFGEVIVWDNSTQRDWKVYGRFAAANMTSREYVYFQDDDVIVPRSTQDELREVFDSNRMDVVVNDAHGENPAGLADVALTATGSLVSQETILETWRKWTKGCGYDHLIERGDVPPHAPRSVRVSEEMFAPDGVPLFYYECDFVFGVLAPSVTLSLPYTNLYPNHGSRLCDQPWQDRAKRVYTDFARDVRDAWELT